MKSTHSSRNASPLRPAFSVGSFKVDSLSIGDDMHPVIHAGRVAVVTGAASGIGRAAAREFASLGLKVAIADTDGEGLAALGKQLVAQVGEANVLVVPTDVSDLQQVVALRDTVYDAWGEVGILMNNAGIAVKTTSWDGNDSWRKTFDVNVFGVINVQHTFVPRMMHQENHAMIVNTGSKQGITNPPGNPAYNASKAAVKSLTESLAHELRESPQHNVTAHLFVPGWTYTALTGAPASSSTPSTKPQGAWSPEETVLYMMDKLREGDFYILVPDNETRREVDQLRIMWAAADVAEGRPALSRWDAAYKSVFGEFMREGLSQLE